MGVRQDNRAAVEAAILRVGRDHLRTYGAAALSLRAVARDLGMVSSGIYRYVESRDELLTRLIVHAYTALAAEVVAAHDRVPRGDFRGRWDAVGRTLRRWALDNPYDYALIYGSPVPDYAAPAERTTGPGTAVVAILTHLLDDIVRDGDHAPPPPDPARGATAKAAVSEMLTDEFFAGTAIGEAQLCAGLSAWTLLVGAVSSEVFGYLGDVADPEALFEWHLATARQLILRD